MDARLFEDKEDQEQKGLLRVSERAWALMTGRKSPEHCFQPPSNLGFRLDAAAWTVTALWITP
jgi:hypothetical protein